MLEVERFQRLRFHMPEFSRPPEVEPLDHIKISMRINAQGVRRGEQRGIGLVVGLVFLAIGFLKFPCRSNTATQGAVEREVT